MIIIKKSKKELFQENQKKISLLQNLVQDRKAQLQSRVLKLLYRMDEIENSCKEIQHYKGDFKNNTIIV